MEDCLVTNSTLNEMKEFMDQIRRRRLEGAPVSITSIPLIRPSVALIATARTLLCCTSQVTLIKFTDSILTLNYQSVENIRGGRDFRDVQ